MKIKLFLYLTVISLFLVSGNVLSAQTQYNKEFFKAVKRGKPEKVKNLLTTKQIDLNAVDDKKYTPLYYAVNKNDLSVSRLLIEKGADVNYTCKPCSGAGYLHIATWNNSADMAKLLIEKGIVVNQQDTEGATPLHYAVQSDFIVLTELLCIAGALVNIEDNAGLSPLDWAEKLLQHDTAKRLKECLK